MDAESVAEVIVGGSEDCGNSSSNEENRGYVSEEEDGTTFTNECNNEEDRASVTDESEINNDDAMPSSKSKKRK